MVVHLAVSMVDLMEPHSAAYSVAATVGYLAHYSAGVMVVCSVVYSAELLDTAKVGTRVASSVVSMEFVMVVCSAVCLVEQSV